MAERLIEERSMVAVAAALGLALAYASARAPLLAVAGMVAIVVLVLVLTRPQTVLIGFIALFPWGGYLDDYPSPELSLTKLFGATIAVAYLIRALGRRELLRFPMTLAWGSLFASLVLVSLLLSSDPSGGASKAASFLLYLIFFFVAVQLLRERSDVERALCVTTASASLAALVSLAAFLLGWGTRAGIGEPNEFAYFMGALLPVALYLFAREPRRRWLWGACFLLLGGTMLATLSRGALVGLGAAVIWAVATRRTNLRGVLAGTAALAGALALAFAFWGPLINERLTEKGKVASQNVASRQALWSAAVDMGSDHPLIGVGPARFGSLTDEYVTDEPSQIVDPVAHNIFLGTLAENGVFALAAFGLFLASGWRLLQSAYRASRAARDRHGARLASALQASMVVTLVSGSFLSIELTLPIWLLPALGVVLAGGLERSRSGGALERARRPPAAGAAPALSA